MSKKIKLIKLKDALVFQKKIVFNGKAIKILILNFQSFGMFQPNTMKILIINYQKTF